MLTYIEKPDEKYCFRRATCILPEYRWEDIYRFGDDDIKRFREIIQSTAHLILEFAQEGGLENASLLTKTKVCRSGIPINTDNQAN
ncbi:MAG: hypothetical protein LUH40_01090 [Clostridiales bacterium]|nr:hypothetical protein [Clostridiales bacterium]